MTSSAPRVAAPYRPRHVRFLRRADVEGWRLKLYGIALEGKEPDREFVEATSRLAGSVLPRPPVTDGRYGVGFATAHDAAAAFIALVYWWQSENELHQRIFVGPKASPIDLEQVENQPAGCVWELEIVDFERRAWLEDVLANPDGPDLERYLSRHVDADV
jgi:hypothetical protein